MPQFFIDTKLIAGSEVEIRSGDARHIVNVLRLKAGDWLVLSDGSGTSFRAHITEARAGLVRAAVDETVAMRHAPSSVTLAHAIIKHDRTEFVIQKAVELGIANIVPFVSERTIPRLASVDDRRLKRWQRIALEAAKQSGLPFKPTVHLPASFETLCISFSSYDTVVLFWEGERTQALSELASSIKPGARVCVVVGPEGGFTSAEVEAARAAGAQTVSLGPQILRVETACVIAAALVQYEMGGFDVAGA